VLIASCLLLPVLAHHLFVPQAHHSLESSLLLHFLDVLWLPRAHLYPHPHHLSLIPLPLSLVACHWSLVACLLSLVACRLSPITCRSSLVFFLLLSDVLWFSRTPDMNQSLNKKRDYSTMVTDVPPFPGSSRASLEIHVCSLPFFLILFCYLLSFINWEL
jgi:hypothetical protein